MKLTIIISGDREFECVEIVHQAIIDVLNEKSLHPSDVKLGHGDCRGADTIADLLAQELGIGEIVKYPYPPNTGLWGGPQRNEKMVRELKPDVVIAFHDNLMSSKGTKNLVKNARKFGVVDIRLYTTKGRVELPAKI
jgi:hypothetical protein